MCRSLLTMVDRLAIHPDTDTLWYDNPTIFKVPDCLSRWKKLHRDIKSGDLADESNNIRDGFFGDALLPSFLGCRIDFHD